MNNNKLFLYKFYWGDSCVVPSTGFEPVAYGLEIHCLTLICRQKGFPRSSYGTSIWYLFYIGIIMMESIWLNEVVYWFNMQDYGQKQVSSP